MFHLEEDLEVDGVDDYHGDYFGGFVLEDEEEALAVVRPHQLPLVEDVQLGSGDEHDLGLGEVGLELILEHWVQLHMFR